MTTIIFPAPAFSVAERVQYLSLLGLTEYELAQGKAAQPTA